jgi:hypothetical protein
MAGLRAAVIVLVAVSLFFLDQLPDPGRNAGGSVIAPQKASVRNTVGSMPLSCR